MADNGKQAERAMARRPDSGTAADNEDAVMLILAQLEALRKLALDIGDTRLATQLGETFEDCLKRHCDNRRLELGETLRHHFKPHKEFLN
jgi:hypothetical protein